MLIRVSIFIKWTILVLYNGDKKLEGDVVYLAAKYSIFGVSMLSGCSEKLYFGIKCVRKCCL